ncbi:Hsp20/alpha crystallin family protein [Pontibacter ramchanderi]|uniref:HSP20 family molecular chaperone IbpA n=1 Tax=Pontibacter ramchanderi TaxID=1179743 RepID=A0A2N3UD56_9BACT|nr:Hsp20/alpha crystallin family protein [Pontibacter ramchanderi]PKV67304.1 HSP20 family molecular chaperone IbpA [Pontibacter ramchanderi]
MRIIKDKEFLKTIAHQIDLLNTVGGGVSETYVEVKKKRKSAIINVWAAGVNPESFKVVLHQNQLTIFSVLQSQEDPQMAVPMFNRIFKLPPQIDLGRIEAIYKDGELRVKLPYHDAALYPRQIDIRQL